MNTATILQRKEIVAVLMELNKKVAQYSQPNSLYSHAQLAIFVELRDHYQRKLSSLDNSRRQHAHAA
ncbi:MAG: hypothetical protein PVF52_05015 [Granulosicoccaceae bacterium]